VTLMVTENIVKWTGPAPEAEILSG